MAGKGQRKTGGRGKGTPNRITQELREAILGAFDEVGGQSYLATIARDDPRTFCVLLGKLVPAQLRAEIETTSRPTLRVLDYTGQSGSVVRELPFSENDGAFEPGSGPERNH